MNVPRIESFEQMEELISHLKDGKFLELKGRLKACTTQAEQHKILGGIDDKRLTEFLSWLQADGAASSALYMVITGLLLKRQFPA
jgi:hypothetical protein